MTNASNSSTLVEQKDHCDHDHHRQQQDGEDGGALDGSYSSDLNNASLLTFTGATLPAATAASTCTFNSGNHGNDSDHGNNGNEEIVQDLDVAVRDEMNRITSGPSPNSDVHADADAHVDVYADTSGDVNANGNSNETLQVLKKFKLNKKQEQQEHHVDQKLDEQREQQSPSLNLLPRNSNDVSNFTSPMTCSIHKTKVEATTKSAGTSHNENQHTSAIDNNCASESQDSNYKIVPADNGPQSTNILKTPVIDSLLSPPNVFRKIIHSGSTVPTMPGTTSSTRSTFISHSRDVNFHDERAISACGGGDDDNTSAVCDHISTKSTCRDVELENDHHHTPYSPIRKLSPSSFLQQSNNNNISSTDRYKTTTTKTTPTITISSTNTSELTSIALHYHKQDRFQNFKPATYKTKNNEGEDDHETSSDTANSLVSEYGSDIGDIRLRMEDVHAMDAVVENEGEEDYDNDDEEEEEKDDCYNVKNNSQQHKTKNTLTQDEQDEQELESQMVSINLSSSDIFQEYGNDKNVIGASTAATITNNTSASFKEQPRPQASTHHQIFDLKQHHNSSYPTTTTTTPKTPIAAVSAAIRRLGTGVSQMARCSNKEENESSTFEYVPQSIINDIQIIKDIGQNNNNNEGGGGFNSDRNYIVRQNNNGIWLSPRFGHHLDEIKPTLQPYSSPTQSPSAKKQQLEQQQPLPSFSPTRSPCRKSQIQPHQQRLSHHNNTTTATATSTSQLLSSPFRHLRGCFPFDPESGKLPYNGASNHSSPPSSPLRLSRKHRFHHRRHNSSGSGCTSTGTGPCHRKSKSWGSSSSAVFTGYGMKSLNIESNDFMVGASATENDHNGAIESKFHLSTPIRMRSNFMQFNANSFRSLTISSPKKRAKSYTQLQQNTMALGSPERVKDIEREDALDILSLLVERSVEYDKKTKLANDGMSRKNENSANINDTFQIDEKKEQTPLGREEKNNDDVQKCLNYFRTCSSKDASGEDVSPLSHEKRIKVLDELEQCHIYATEMKRASLSAQTWLRSVGRPSSSLKNNQRSGGCETATHTIQVPTFINNDVPTDHKMLKSMVISYQQQLREKDDMNARLNQELSTCRAEIGRLKTMKRNENQFISPNKSILDEEVDDDDSSGSSTTNEFPNISDIHLSVNPEIIDKSAMVKNEEERVLEQTEINALKREICKLKEQLKQAGKESMESEPSSTSVKPNKENDNHEELGNDRDDKTMVNVRMLDAENFVTDWNNFGPLPPPPDHELDSPIVTELLNQWTTDKSTQRSLLSWIERVMEGEDPALIQPLQISSLNHEIRDAFIHHILPILLRRNDILVELSSRAHRHTSYDIAVSIKKSLQQLDMSRDNGELLNASMAPSPHIMAFKLSGSYDWLESSRISNVDASVTYGSATTALISNHHMLQHDEKSCQERDSAKVNEALKESSPQSIVSGALNAVGELLSRRKGSQSHKIKRNEGQSTSDHSNSPSLNAQESHDSSLSIPTTNEEDQPYHRVVSAPPGKIGITFVQYRGHAMISDVLNESPLLGWVFPSDIVIAIDEVPVSGMRVPEIVKLLTARKERQRALRLISSHAMTELLITQESGALIDG